MAETTALDDPLASFSQRMIAYQRGSGSNWYGGWTTTVFLDPVSPSEALPADGPLVGVVFPTKVGPSVQVELTARPISYSEDALRFGIKSVEDGELGGAVLPALPQLGVGYNF